MNLTSPKNWKMVKLGDVASIKHGYAFKGEYFSETPTNKILLTPGNFSIGGGWKEGKKFYNEVGEIPEDYILDSGDLVVSMTDLSKEGDTLGYSALVPNDPLRVFLHNQRVGLVKNNEDLSYKNFLYYLLRSRSYQRYVVNTATGSTVKHTSPTKILEYEFPLPTLDEQKEIAAILGSLDEKIELLRRENKTLENIAQALFREWFVEFRFPGYEGVKVEDGVPEGWKVGTVMDVIDRLSISYKCDKDDLDPQGKTPIIDQGTTGLYGYTKRDPDMQASTENPVIVFTNHTCNLWFINYPFCAIQNVIPFRGKDGYDEYFIYFMTKGQVSFIEYKGHWPDFEIKEYVIPPAEIAKQFSEAVKPMVHKMWGNSAEIQTLSRLRDDLLNKIFSN